ncbi:hypothetical protein Dimus_001604 [Dionaea muscipula]
MDSLAEFGPINLSNLIKRLHHQIGSPKISHIIANPFVPWVAGVAAELGIPYSMLWIQPCSLFSIYYHFLNKLKDFPTLENPEISVQLPGLPLMNRSDLPSLVALSLSADSPSFTISFSPSLSTSISSNLHHRRRFHGSPTDDAVLGDFVDFGGVEMA